MNYSLAQFPLQIVVFPGERIPLHIFEPRYRELISDCENHGIPFGITPLIDGNLMEVGTSMQLRSIKKRYPDGRLDVIVEATHTYEIHQFYTQSDTRSYGSAEVADLAWESSDDALLNLEIRRLMEELYQVMRIPREKIPSRFHLYQVVHKIGLSLMEEYEILAITDTFQRQTKIRDRLEVLLPQVRKLEEIRKRIEMNGDTRLIIPPG